MDFLKTDLRFSDAKETERIFQTKRQVGDKQRMAARFPLFCVCGACASVGSTRLGGWRPLSREEVDPVGNKKAESRWEANQTAYQYVAGLPLTVSADLKSSIMPPTVSGRRWLQLPRRLKRRRRSKMNVSIRYFELSVPSRLCFSISLISSASQTGACVSSQHSMTRRH